MTTQSLEASIERINSQLQNHVGSKVADAASKPHLAVHRQVNAITEIAPSRQNEFTIIALRAIPGTASAKIYICLGDNAATTAYSWVEVAAG